MVNSKKQITRFTEDISKDNIHTVVREIFHKLDGQINY